MSAVDVSILMCTHNRAAMLREAIGSLVRQETDGKFKYEVLIVHSGSAESVNVIEEERKRADVPVRAAYQPHRGISVARNRALEEASGDWFAWFDDDQLADPAWLKELLAIAVEKNSPSTGGVRLLRLPEGCDRADANLSTGPRRKYVVGGSAALQPQGRAPWGKPLTPSQRVREGREL